MSHTVEKYFVPEPSTYPIWGSFALLFFGTGAVFWLNDVTGGPAIFFLGLALLLYMMFGWFGQVIKESEAGLYGKNVDRSFRWSMGWFIFSEVMFFAAFFGALFYVRVFSLPWLSSGETEAVLWEGFQATWPAISAPYEFAFEEFSPMGAWGIPAFNTLILLTSGVTLTWAHHALLKNNRDHAKKGLLLTVLLGVIFLSFQMYEYFYAYSDLNLRFDSGIYGSVFYMLTGFHGIHVTIGAIMLFIMYLRLKAGHFKPDNHFAFEATAWYWHFVDVVWLFLFVVIYWL
jgi:cytochrome c oxidase subunit III